ncbi:restriction endonuclease subunit S [Streptomyces sparsogenes]|uniref:restriction endonuclease subunit S n=1 Tax=Streptomyces sparsogenes TaxID=67365 RepID=UPI00340642C2
MRAWSKVTIGELGRVVTGATPRTGDDAAWGDEVDFITPTEMSYSNREPTGCRRLSREGLEPLTRRLIPAGSVLFACIGFSTGKVARISRPAVTNQQVNSLVPDPSVIDSRFAYYLLRKYSTDIRHIASGSTTPIVNKSTFQAFEVELPGLPEQRTIAAVLGALDDKIAVNERIITTADELIRCLFSEALLQPGVREVGVFDALDIIFGAPFASTQFNSEQVGRPLLRIRDLKTFQPQVWTTQRLDKELVVAPGDTVAGMDAEFRPTFWLGESALLNQRVLHARSRVGGGSPLSREVLRTPLATIEGYKTGTTVAHLNKGDLMTLRLEIPSSAAIASFEALAEPVHKRIVAAAAESRTLAALRETLLPQLMSGKLRLRDAERIVEDAA